MPSLFMIKRVPFCLGMHEYMRLMIAGATRRINKNLIFVSKNLIADILNETLIFPGNVGLIKSFLLEVSVY